MKIQHTILILLFSILSFSTLWGQQVRVQTYFTCTYVMQANVTEPACFGDGGGVIELVFTGIASSPELQWLNINASTIDQVTDAPVQDGLFAGEYKVRVADDQGCVDTLYITISEPEEVLLEAEPTDVTCPNATDGQINLGASGGVGKFEFSLDGITFFDSETFQQLAPDVYEVFVKDQNNCVKSNTIVIEEPPIPTVEVEKEDVSCPNGNDAVFIIVIDSGVLFTGEDYDYSLDGTTYQPDSTFEDLEAGEYIAYARNKVGCITTENIVVTQPTNPVITIDPEHLLCNGNDDGSVLVKMTGATPPYLFSLNNNDFQSQNIFQNLSAGNYQMYISDANGCEFTHPFSITEPTPLVNNITFANAKCGTSNGWISCSPNGGVSPFEFKWNTGNTTSNLLGIDKGNYTVTLTDDNGCTVTKTIPIINEVAPRIQSSVEHVTCNGDKNGAIELVVQGFPPYEINWSTGINSTEIENLEAGNYTVTITDKNNCFTSKHFQVKEPDSISITPKIDNSGLVGNIALGVVGGTPPFSYEWKTGETTKILKQLKYGIYEVTVTDNNDCSAETSIELDLPNKPVELKKMLNIYPVPTLDELFIKIDLPVESNMLLQVYDEFGRSVFDEKTNAVKRSTITLNLQHLPSGTYFIKLTSGLHTHTRRFIKMTE